MTLGFGFGGLVGDNHPGLLHFGRTAILVGGWLDADGIQVRFGG